MEVGSKPGSLLIAVPGPKGNFRKGSKMTFGGKWVFRGGLAPPLQTGSGLLGEVKYMATWVHGLT